MLKLRLPRLLALGALTLGFFSTAFAQEFTPKRVGPVSQYGQLQAGRNALGQGRIYGNCPTYATPGNEVQVKGMSLFWSNYTPNAQLWNRQIIEGLVNRHKIQIIRAPMAVDDNGWGNRHYFAETKTDYYQQLLDSVVVAAIENDIYVIIDYHSHVAADYTNRAMEFFKIQAKKWGGYNNVIFEIFNEPLCAHGSQGDNSNCENYGGMLKWGGIKKYADQVIPVIRRYSDNLIVVGTPQWDQYPNDAASDPIADNNVAYTFHYYAGTHMIEWEGMHAEQAMNDGLSVFVTEWGTVNADGAGNVSESNWSWQEWLNQNQLSSANWTVGKNKSGSEYFYIDFNPDGEWVYTESGQWMNDKVFSTLPENDSYTSCGLSYDQVPEDTWPVDEFGNVYEGGDYLIDNFDGKGIRYSSYHYGWNNDGGTWSYDENNSGAVYNSDVGSNVATITNISAGADGEGGVGYEISVDDGIAGCENLFYRFSGTAHTVKFVIKGDEDGALTGWDQHHLYVDGNDVWTTSFISTARDLEGGAIDLDLDKVVKIKFEMAGSKYDWFYMDDLQCATEMPSSSSSSSSSGSIVAEAYMVDNFSGNGTAEYDYVFADKWTIANDMVHPGWAIDDPDYMEYVKTTNDPEQGVVGAVLQVTRVGNDDGGAGIGVHVPKNLSGCATLQYKYKGLEHNLAFFNEQEKVIYAEHFNRADKGWVTVTYDMNRAVAEGLDINSALDIQWHALEPDGETDLLIDDVECVAPASSSSSSSGNALAYDVSPNYKYVYAGDGWTIANEEGENGLVAEVIDEETGKPVIGLKGVVAENENGWAGIGMNVSDLDGCQLLQYDYKGLPHNLALANTPDGDDVIAKYGIPATDAWETFTLDMSALSGIDLQSGLDIKWQLAGTGNGNLYVNNVRCAVPSSSSSSGDEPASSSSIKLPVVAAPTANMELFDDFEDGDYYPLWDGIGQWWAETDVVGGGGSSNAELSFVKGSASAKALQMSYSLDVGDYPWGPPYATISTNDFNEMNLSQCSEVRYDYKGAAHKFRLKVSSTVNGLLDMGWGFPTFAVTSPSESWQTVTIPVASLRQEWTGSSGNWVDVETVLQYANGFDWRVDGEDTDDKSSGTLAIDNIRCVGLAETQYYTITFKNGDEDYEVKSWAAGSNVPDPAGVPAKAPDAQYTYVFDYWTWYENEWGYPTRLVVGDATYEAVYTEITNTYTVTFLLDDGETVYGQVEGVKYGTPVLSIAPPDPSKEDDSQFTYTFDGWDPSFDSETIVEGAITYKATYTQSLKSYDITFKDDDGTVLAKVSEFYGTPADEIEAPEVLGAAGKKFAGWNPGLAKVTGEAVYTAVYTDKYVITWKDYNGDVLKTDFLDEGDMPEYGDDPTREATAQYSYVFAGWDHEVEEVTDDDTYTAVYTETVNSYTVAFYDDDGTPLGDETVEYGTLVSDIAPIPTKASTDQYSYTFAGWNPEITDETVVEGEATYTAVYTQTVNIYTVYFQGEEGVTNLPAAKTAEYGTLVSDLLPSSDPVKAPDARYTYEFEKWYDPITMDETMYLPADATLESNMTLMAVFRKFDRKYLITFLNEDGSQYGTANLYAYGTPASDITPTEDPVKPADEQYSYVFAGWDPEVQDVTGEATYTATFTTESAETYTVTYKCFSYADGEYRFECTGLPEQVTVDAGTLLSSLVPKSTPVMTATAADAYTFNGWVLYADVDHQYDIGEDDVVEDVPFSHITLAAVFDWSLRQYTVAFVDEDGETVLKAAADYDYGTEFGDVVVPEVQPKEGKNFVGWTPTPSAVTGNVTYKAVYEDKVYYTVTYVCEDFTDGPEASTCINLPETKTVEAGTLVSTLIPTVNPEIPQTQQYVFDFSEWLIGDGDDIETVDENITITALFDWYLRQYTISFVDWNNTPIYSDSYDYGTEASIIVPAENPTRADDEQFSYTFADWTPTVADVTGDATYKATYTKTALSSSSSETVVSSSSEGTESSSSETVVSSSSETAPSSSSVVPSSSSTTPSSSSVKPSSSSVKPESSADEDDKSSSSRGKDRSSSSVSEDEPSSSEAKDDKDDKSSSSGKTDALFPTVAGLNMVFSHNELTVTVPKASEVKVQVFDMQGNLQERYQGYSAGDHVVSLRHLNKGVYIVRVASGNAVKTQRIMIK